MCYSIKTLYDLALLTKFCVDPDQDMINVSSGILNHTRWHLYPLKKDKSFVSVIFRAGGLYTGIMSV